MPRFTYPIEWDPSQPDPAGPVRIRMTSRLPILLRTAAGGSATIRALVDTGASFSFMPTATARAHGLAIPDQTSRITLMTANGLHSVTVRDSVFAVRFPRLPELEFDLLWLLRDDLPLDAPVQLGLHNTVDLLSILFDGGMRPDGMTGCMEFTTRDA